ncbi:hypothetical protein JR316_0010790 [Psilocybe cubensis]|nr:hypothetical protein JR316_0010790 [Psilocybe cubensis]KAH9476874.1 hypothetical protein JR316_0010790 [Psilocybe cubensis]
MASSSAFKEFMDQRIPEAMSLKPYTMPSNIEVATAGSASASAEKVTLSIQELGKRVMALDEAIEADKMAAQPFFYQEEELMAFYEDVLAIPDSEVNDQASREAEEKAIGELRAQEDLVIIDQLEKRLCPPEGEPAMLPSHMRILRRAKDIVSRVEAARRRADPNASSQPLVPMGVLSAREYEALVRACIKEKDWTTAEVALEVAKTSGLPITEEVLTSILSLCMSARKALIADRLLSDFLTGPPTEVQRDLHVRTHLLSTNIRDIPESALTLLHEYENRNIPAPMKTYTCVIASLLSRSSSLARAHAWDLFSHMRYVAHPDPDAELYTLMIEACAFPVSVAYSSEPEKALDLWTEMTSDHNISPTIASYNAVILACARSGDKSYVSEAFRLARRMLDSHRDARGFSAFRPDYKTFCALLEGCKRIGDLAKARWILAEMARRRTGDEPNSVDVKIGHEAMSHIFHTYASYKPPIVRSRIPSVATDEVSEVDTAQRSPPTASSSSNEEAQHIVDNVVNATEALTELHESMDGEGYIAKEDEPPSSSVFLRTPPQTSEEVIQEVQFLLEAIIQDRKSSSSLLEEGSPSAVPFSKPFQYVTITPRLISSYLSVYYAHAPLAKAREVFNTIFDRVGIECSPLSCVDALERCAKARRGPEREIASTFSDDVWAKWLPFEDASSNGRKGLPARLIERANIARIRLLALIGDISRSMAQLRIFAAKYPPEGIKTPPPKLSWQSTRTALVGKRPLVRMTPVVEVPDDTVPPLLTFRNIDVLHQRLIYEDRVSDIAYLTWLCKSYEWGLRIRRDKAHKSKAADA